MQWLGILIFGLVLVFFVFQVIGMVKDVKAKKAKKKSSSESGEVPPEEDKSKKEV